jgi:hypothetical protein
LRKKFAEFGKRNVEIGTFFFGCLSNLKLNSSVVYVLSKTCIFVLSNFTLGRKKNECSKYPSDEWIIDLRKYYGFKRNCNFFEECNIISGLYYLTSNWNWEIICTYILQYLKISIKKITNYNHLEYIPKISDDYILNYVTMLKL